MKSEGFSSPLARADFGRQRDVYKLAALGNARCRRMWDDFAAEAPGPARLVAADVESERADSVKARESVDRVLVKAEKRAKAGKRARAGVVRSGPAPGVYSVLADIAANSADPAEREAAKRALGL